MSQHMIDWLYKEPDNYLKKFENLGLSITGKLPDTYEPSQRKIEKLQKIKDLEGWKLTEES